MNFVELPLHLSLAALAVLSSSLLYLVLVYGLDLGGVKTGWVGIDRRTGVWVLFFHHFFSFDASRHDRIRVGKQRAEVTEAGRTTEKGGKRKELRRWKMENKNTPLACRDRFLSNALGFGLLGLRWLFAIALLSLLSGLHVRKLYMLLVNWAP